MTPEFTGRLQTRGSGQTTRPPLDDILLLFATLLFGLSVWPGTLSAVPVLAASVALGLSIARSKKKTEPSLSENPGIDGRLLVGVALFGVLGLVGWSPTLIGPSSALVERLPGGIFLLLALAASISRRVVSKLWFVSLAAVTLTTVAVFGSIHIEMSDDLGLDVYHLHIATADAIANRENPYTDAVTVPDWSPNAEPGDVITGYVYPPITGVFYAAGHWLTPDTRYTSLAAWLVVLTLVGYSAVKHRSNRSLYVMMLLASVPGLWLVLRAAWTEPLSLMFIAIALAIWAKPATSGAGLGAMLASKQYFLVTAPVLLLHRDSGWLRRLILAGVAITLTIAPALIWDARAFWDSGIAFHTSTEARADSNNIVGLLALADVKWVPPTIVPLGVGLVAAIWAGGQSTTKRSFLGATALALAASFLVTSQAFANYWLLIFGLCALALLQDGSSTTVSPSQPRPPPEAPASTR